MSVKSQPPVVEGEKEVVVGIKASAEKPPQAEYFCLAKGRVPAHRSQPRDTNGEKNLLPKKNKVKLPIPRWTSRMWPALTRKQICKRVDIQQ